VFPTPNSTGPSNHEAFDSRRVVTDPSDRNRLPKAVRHGPVPIEFSVMARADILVDHLRQVTLFATCSRRDLQKVAHRSQDMRVAAGTTIVHEGDDGDEFFVILDGTASVSRHGSKVATLGPGSGFGELALLIEDAPRNATVVADTDMELVVLGQPQFDGLLNEVPGFARKMLSGTAHRLREADFRAIQ
jgi:CRP/FNR family transcriptional regulator, cyclic AMP receptor protein